MAPATAPTGPSTRAPDNAPSAASPVRSWAIAAELSARESVTAAIVFFIRYLPPTLHKNNNIGGVLALCRGCHINQTMSAGPRAFVLVLQLSTAYPQSAETHHDRIMNPTAASVLGCVAANCSAGLRLELTALAGGTLRYAARVCFLRFRGSTRQTSNANFGAIKPAKGTASRLPRQQGQSGVRSCGSLT